MSISLSITNRTGYEDYISTSQTEGCEGSDPYSCYIDPASDPYDYQLSFAVHDDYKYIMYELKNTKGRPYITISDEVTGTVTITNTGNQKIIPLPSNYTQVDCSLHTERPDGFKHTGKQYLISPFDESKDDIDISIVVKTLQPTPHSP